MPVTVMPGMSAFSFSSSPHGRVQLNDISFTTFEETIRVQLVLSCMLEVGDLAVNAG